MKRAIFNLSSIRAPLTGIGRYSVELLSRLIHSGYPVTAIYNGTLYCEDSLVELIDGLDVVENDTASTVSNWRRHVGRMPFSRQLYRSLDKKKFQRKLQQITEQHLVHDINFTWSASPLKNTPDVSTVFDLSFLHHANTHPSNRVHYLRGYLTKLQKSDCQIITISDSIKQELVEHHGVDCRRVHVTQLAADAQFQPMIELDCASVLKQYGLYYKQYVLCVGTLEPRKNLTTVLDAFEAMDASLQHAFPLVVVGALGWKAGKLSERLNSLQQKGVAMKLGFVPQSQLPKLYAAAAIFAYPSLYEGFGLPVLEAMQSGCPVITSNSGALAEVAGQAAVTIKPESVPELEVAMSKLLQDNAQQKQYSDAGRKRAKKFSWQQTVDQTTKVYHAL